ncbi:alpha/beta hydrolase family protein [Nocardia nova SH22a]|uniref:Alpha/beta hydrolase family protein n=1 Tax=Nocardia nova SH22a TaxID=1415166 RepID=W5THG2_9NOCA|nr:hypothetical protein [Nocardia nova]AHH18662.1 alpha/beta hydrolase family protein [Nocardia nova SH22a]
MGTAYDEPRTGPLARLAAVLTCAAAALALTACEQHDESAKYARGELLSSEPLLSMDAAQAGDYVRQHGFDAAAVRFGVDAYRVLYRSTDDSGSDTVASGIAAFPRTQGDPELPVTMYLHGTNPVRTAAASVADSPDRAAVVLLAGSGRATTAPDYQGLGLGRGAPAYLIAGPTVRTAVDGLTASRALAHQQDRQLRRRVDVTGFSQGAHAAIPVARALQDGSDPQSSAGAVAAVAGPHDLFGTELEAALDGRLNPHEATLYLAYFTTSWNRTYHLYASPGEAFNPPYDRKTDALFDGSHSLDEIIPALPGSPGELLRPDFIRKLLHPSGNLARAVADNDDLCVGAHLHGPVKLFHGTADTDVAYANSERCRDSLAASGTQVELVDAGSLDHTGTALSSFPAIAAWLEELS